MNNGFIGINGKHLIDANGDLIRFRGTNLGNWLLLEGYMFQLKGGPQSQREIERLILELAGPEDSAEFWREYRERYVTEEDIRFLKNCGCNLLRIPLHHKFFADANSEGFRLVDRVIDWCAAAGIYTVLDLHSAPGGQTGTNIDDGCGHPWLFESPGMQQATIDLWVRLARHYRDNTCVIGYDLLNEPIPHYPGLERLNELLEPLYRRITAAIREVDQHHLIFPGGAQWNTNFKVFGAPFDDKAVYNFHKYWTEPNVTAISEYLAYRDRYNVPLWCSETGENTDEWVEAFRKLLDEHQIDWTFWPYKKMANSSGFVSFTPPRHWEKIVEYATLSPYIGGIEKKYPSRPTRDEIRECLADLLEQIRFKNCTINNGYIKALGLNT